MTSETKMLLRPRVGGGSSGQTGSRLLILFDVLGEPVQSPHNPPDRAVSVMSSLTRVEKLDFWMRNPDYLADELLTEVEEQRLTQAAVASHVERMLSETGRLHLYPMRRYKYGAYERVDNPMSMLASYGAIVHRRRHDGENARHDYFLLEEGKVQVGLLRAAVPQLAWYDQQAQAIGMLAEAVRGAHARERQYRQPEYRDALIGSDIPEIFDRVQARAHAMGFTLDHPEGVAA